MGNYFFSMSNARGKMFNNFVYDLKSYLKTKFGGTKSMWRSFELNKRLTMQWFNAFVSKLFLYSIKVAWIWITAPAKTYIKK